MVPSCRGYNKSISYICMTHFEMLFTCQWLCSCIILPLYFFFLHKENDKAKWFGIFTDIYISPNLRQILTLEFQKFQICSPHFFCSSIKISQKMCTFLILHQMVKQGTALNKQNLCWELFLDKSFLFAHDCTQCFLKEKCFIIRCFVQKVGNGRKR